MCEQGPVEAEVGLKCLRAAGWFPTAAGDAIAPFTTTEDGNVDVGVSADAELSCWTWEAAAGPGEGDPFAAD